MANSFILFQKTYDLLLWLYPVINRIPKSHRPVLGRNIEELAISLLVTMVRANKDCGQARTSLQSLISDDLDSLRILLRLTKDLRLMSINQYTLGAEKINEIGRMFNSWRRVVESYQGENHKTQPGVSARRELE